MSKPDDLFANYRQTTRCFNACFDGGRTQARTVDPLIKSQLLYQLSYAPIEVPPKRVIRRGGVLAGRAVPVHRASFSKS